MKVRQKVLREIKKELREKEAYSVRSC